MPFRERLEHGDALGADGQAVGGVLDVAAGDDRAVGGFERGADLESGVRRDGAFAGPRAPRRRGGQSRSMMPSSSAMNWPRTRSAVSITSSWTQRLRQDAGRHVGDARDAEHLEAHVPRDDGLRRGGHADGVGAQRAERANLGRRLVAGAVDRDVDAVLDRQPGRRRGGSRRAHAGATNRPRSCRETAGRSARRCRPTSGLLPIRLM